MRCETSNVKRQRRKGIEAKGKSKKAKIEAESKAEAIKH